MPSNLSGTKEIQINKLPSITIKVKTSRVLTMRLRIGLFLIRLGSYICTFEYEYEESD